MFRQRCRLVFADSCLCHGDDVRANQLGLAFQFGQHLPGSGFVAAARRLGPHHAGAVPPLGDVER
jgi:hypothetical protein